MHNEEKPAPLTPKGAPPRCHPRPIAEVVCYSSAPTSRKNISAPPADSESGLDNFGARFNSSNLGRFLSPDDPSGPDNEQDPQGLNLYSYVQNNPMNAVDPDGHDCFYIQESAAYVIRGDCSAAPGGATAVTYVPGTINEKSGVYDANTGTVSFSYTPYWTPPWESPKLSFEVIGNVHPTHSGPTEFDKFVSRVAVGADNVNAFALQVGIQDIAGVLGRMIGAGIESVLAARAAANAAAEAAEVANLATKAASTVGNQGAVASSKATALAAAEEFVGPGARPIVDRATGQVVGKISADGSKVYRITSINKAQPYVNLVNNTTGGNLHVRF